MFHRDGHKLIGAEMHHLRFKVATGSGEMIRTLNHACASASESNPVFSKHLKQSQTYYRHHYCQTRNKIGQIRPQNGSDIHSLVALGSKNHNYLLTAQIIFCRSRKERVNFVSC